MENKRSKAPIYILFLVVAVALVGFFIYRSKAGDIAAVDETSEEIVVVEIPSGSSTKKIAEILDENDLIRSKFAFESEAKKTGSSANFKAGTYELSKSMDVHEIFQVLETGYSNVNTVKLTIPEGYELDDIAKKLSDSGFDGDKFLELSENKNNFQDDFVFLKELEDEQSLEGFLFPDTYEFYKDTSEEEIIRVMLKGFEKIYESDLKDNLKNVDMDLNEAVTLGSIIEREGKLDSERPKISAVFHNRIEIGMPLQSCATVQYILGERKENLSNKDISIDSPYNTYINDGLPPAPISSVGKASLVAAVKPEEDFDYLYFVLTGDDGSHTFTKTYDEHLKANPKK